MQKSPPDNAGRAFESKKSLLASRKLDIEGRAAVAEYALFIKNKTDNQGKNDTQDD